MTHQIETESWRFPDAKTTGETADYTFEENGSREVSLHVVDDDGADATYTGTVNVDGEAGNLGPDVYFTYEPILPNTTSTVTFTADATDTDGEIIGYEWTFPNGSIQTGETAVYNFSEAGARPVTLEVEDDDNATANYTGDVTVLEPSNTAPLAFFTYEPITPTVNETVTFTADANDFDGEIDTRTWRVNGVTAGAGEQLQLTFTQAGAQEVTLAVTDDDGATSNYSVSVYVQENGTNESLWGADDPTALGTCSLPTDNGTTTGLLVEYWDPDYETVALHSNVTWDGTTYQIDKQFDEPKGYYFGCVGVGEDVTPGDAAENATANTTVEFANGSSATFNDTGVDDFQPENSLSDSGGFLGGGGGGGPLIGPDAGSDAPVWATAIPAIAAIAFVGYRQFQKGGGGSGGGGDGGAGGSGGQPPRGGPA